MPWDEFEQIDKQQIINMQKEEQDRQERIEAQQTFLVKLKEQMDAEERRRREERNQDWNEMEENQQEEQAEQEEQIPKGMYRHNNKVKNVDRIFNLRGIREIVLRLMPGALQEKLKIETGLRPAIVKLHHSKGTKLYNDGTNVLEFDMAGSGFKQFPQPQEGISIDKKDFIEVTEDGKTHKVGIEHMTAKDDVKPRWYNKTRWLSWIPGVRSMKRINEINEFRSKHPEFRSGEGGFAEKYGEKLKDKDCIYVKSKTTVRKDGMEVEKRRITMAGPLAGGGVVNAGKYSIESLRKNMLLMGKEYLEPKLIEWRALNEMAKKLEELGRKEDADKLRTRIHPAHIIMKGHSRGAVALSHGAMMIKYWLKENYPDMLEYVKFDTIQYDPVPGTGDDYNVKKELNLNEKDSKKLKELEKRKMAPLGDYAETTVFYSLLSNHPVCFAPQTVKGTKRLILTMHDHTQGLKDVDDTQEKMHRAGYTNAKTGEVYRGSGLSELPEGVYIMDETRTLIRLNSKEKALNMLKEVYKDTYKILGKNAIKSKIQGSRKNRLKEVVEAWFSSHQQGVEQQNV